MSNYAIPREVGWRERLGGVLVANIAEGECYELRGIEAFIWLRLASGADDESVISGICERYSIQRDVAEADAATFIAQLRESKLLQ